MGKGTTMTPARLDELQSLCDAATEGPWTHERPPRTGDFTEWMIIAAVAHNQGIYARPPGGSFPYSDQKFIAASRTAMPDLIAEVRRLRAIVDKLPKTADGVPITHEMQVWYLIAGEPEYCRLNMTIDGSPYYSTREAALAAHKTR